MSKLIHFAWFGPDEMPEKYERYIQAWHRMNPDWTVKVWGPGLLNDLQFNISTVFDLRMREPSIPRATQLADVAAYEIIWRHGGVYLNCDLQPVRPLSELAARVKMDETGFLEPFASYEDEKYLVNAVMGGPPKAAMWRDCMHAVGPRFQANPTGPMNVVTGPLLLTEVAGRHPELVRLSRETFNPVHYSTIPIGEDAEGWFDEDELHPDTIGVHHWGHRKTGRSNFVL